MRTVALAVVSLVGLATPSAAQYVGNYPAWRDLSASEKTGYVMAVYDSSIASSFAGDQYADANSKGMVLCVSQMKLTPPLLVEMVERKYAGDTAQWRDTPSGVLYRALLQLCKPSVNRFRAEMGLELLK